MDGINLPVMTYNVILQFCWMVVNVRAPPFSYVSGFQSVGHTAPGGKRLAG